MCEDQVASGATSDRQHTNHNYFCVTNDRVPVQQCDSKFNLMVSCRVTLKGSVYWDKINEILYTVS